MAVYVIVVFLGPWLVFAWLLWREWSFVRSHGIVVTAQNWQTEWPRLKRFRAEDPQARYLHGLVTKWLRVTLVMWAVGFVILGSVLFLLDRAGMLLGPSQHARRGRSTRALYGNVSGPLTGGPAKGTRRWQRPQI